MTMGQWAAEERDAWLAKNAKPSIPTVAAHLEKRTPLNNPDRVGKIRDVLYDFGTFQTGAGLATASFSFDLDGVAVDVAYDRGTLVVTDQHPEETGWMIPLSLLAPRAVQPDSEPPEGTDGGSPAVSAPVVSYAVANEDGQLGAGRWNRIEVLVRELYPLRADLQVVAVEENDGLRGLNPAEAIKLGLALTQMGGMAANA